MDTKTLAKLLRKLDEQSFRPGDSVVASTINHPIDAIGKFGGWLANQVNTAAGIPDQYDNPYPYLAPSPEAQTQAAFDVAGMAQLGSMPFAPKSAGGTVGSITAWHGSPHKFDKFDMSKIGTGEGAQAYGHGLYFAENPEVAQSYRASTTKGFDLPDGENVQGVANVIALRGEDAARKLYSELGDDLEPIIAKAKQAIDQNSNLYKTSLEWPDPAREAADPLGPHHFLDWDKPLSEQSPFIQELLKKSGYWPEEVDPYKYNPFAADPDFVFGKEIASSSDNAFNNDRSADLLKHGIPGIRYLDGGSRGAGEGSYNYVVFDDQIPRIVERNGQPVNALAEALRNPDNLNESLLQKYLQQGSLTPDELAQYERNAVAMRDSSRQYLNVANADAQGGTAMDRARDMGFYTGNSFTKEMPKRDFNVNSGEDMQVFYHGGPKNWDYSSFKESGGQNFYDPSNINGGYAFLTTSKGEAKGYADELASRKGIKSAVHEFLIRPEASTKVIPSSTGKNLPNYKEMQDLGYGQTLVDLGRYGKGADDTYYRHEWLLPYKPEQIRSTKAAFDPLRKNSADLLATKLLPASMLGIGMYGMEQDRKNPLAEALRGQ